MEDVRQHPASPTTDPRGNVYSGMTLRDYFASQALSLVQWHIDAKFNKLERPEYVKELANASYQISDAMLKERSKQ